jgi:outer membrane protein OmpA-like peptidoglycan-associated protein
MKQILLIVAILATTTVANAQLTLETRLAAPIAYTDFETAKAGSEIGLRLGYDFSITPNITGGVFTGVAYRALRLGSFVRDHGYGEIGARIQTGNRFQLFGEGSITARPFRYAAANANVAMGAQWRTKANTVIGVSLSGERNIAVPDGLDNAIRGKHDIVVTPRVFVRLPLFKKQRQAKPPVVQAPAPVFSVQETRDRLLNDSVFGQAIVQLTSYLVRQETEPLRKNDSFLLSKIQRVFQRTEVLEQQKQEAPIQKQAKSETLTLHFKAGASDLSFEQLDGILSFVDKIPKTAQVLVIGASSSTGTKLKNQKIAQARIDCGIEALKKSGFRSERIQTRIRPYQGYNVADQYLTYIFNY